MSVGGHRECRPRPAHHSDDRPRHRRAERGPEPVSEGTATAWFAEPRIADRSIGKRAGLGQIHPHMLRSAFIMAALDAGVPLRHVQLAARHEEPRTTTI
jgi:integrase